MIGDSTILKDHPTEENFYLLIRLGFKRQNPTAFYPPPNPLPRGDFLIPLLGRLGAYASS
ncbi:MAG: hypothetical protein JETT_0559 [Candidatus Jettenia ecosi]|uniref:Uncharacterized protein n=1 Tax=Candidatus Jettenia ecosi TaxID=2494326 RepID=A0A533QEN9_9BACT|nr:MAG: hypothetical protein JETT_0559 [Candidatus Jettenia ecosi]